MSSQREVRSQPKPFGNAASSTSSRRESHAVEPTPAHAKAVGPDLNKSNPNKLLTNNLSSVSPMMRYANKGMDVTHQGVKPTKESANGEYRAPYASAAFSGVSSDQAGTSSDPKEAIKEGGEGISFAINNDNTPHAYAAYGNNPHSYEEDAKKCWATQSVNPWGSLGDFAKDAGAVTQYVKAADENIHINSGINNSKKNCSDIVAVDWDSLGKKSISASNDFNIPFNYDTPKNVAELGSQAVMADIAEKKGNPEDKNQFISLLGHSGGGQSSFFTALKLAQDGYTNLSLVGVDMVLSGHERKALETLGVNVTNITSNATIANECGIQTNQISEIGQLNKVAAGEAFNPNYYDSVIERKDKTTDRHGMTNDVNVITEVRFNQYLDSTNKHGQRSPQLYSQFLEDTNYTGNRLINNQYSSNNYAEINNRSIPDYSSGMFTTPHCHYED